MVFDSDDAHIEMVSLDFYCSKFAVFIKHSDVLSYILVNIYS